MFQLLQIQVENLGCFGQVTLHPRESTLLLGANGAGKSTLLDVLYGLRSFIVKGCQAPDAFPGYRLDQAPAVISLELATRRGPLRYELVLDQPTGAAWTVLSESFSHGDQVVARFVDGSFSAPGVGQDIPLSKDRSSLAAVRFPAESSVELFRAWLDGIWLLRLEPRRMLREADEPAQELDVSGQNFVAWLLGFDRRREQLRLIVASLDGSVPGLEALRLERAGREHVLVAQLAGGAQVDFDRLSDGQRCLIVLHAVIVLARRSCRLLLLDEPDAHVTPTEILPLFAALRSQVVERGAQVMVASHHPQVIDLLAAEAPWEFVLREGRATAEPFRVPLDRGIPASRHLLLRGRR